MPSRCFITVNGLYKKTTFWTLDARTVRSNGRWRRRARAGPAPVDDGGETPEESNGGLAFWGTGAYGRGGRGSNWNGKILMEERAAIRKGERD